MSYSIVYDRVVIKHGDRYTFVILVGDNNTYCGFNSKKRSRHWSVSNFNATAEEIYEHYFSMCGTDFQEHFMWGRKFLDDVELMKWVQNGIKNALSIEEICKRLKHSVWCSAQSWSPKTYSQKISRLDATVSTTADYINWVNLIETEIKENFSGEITLYPYVEFSYDDAVHLGKPTKDVGGQVLIKVKGKYVVEFAKTSETSECYRWKTIVSKKSDAYIFNLDIPGDKCVVEHFLGPHQVVKYNPEEKSQQKYVIEMRHKTQGNIVGYYERSTPKRIIYSSRPCERIAKTLSSAKAIVKRMEQCPIGIVYSIVPYSCN